MFGGVFRFVFISINGHHGVVVSRLDRVIHCFGAECKRAGAGV
jgi:hypothetical protein